MSDSPVLDRIDEEAAFWFGRLQRPIVSQDDIRGLRQWRRSDPAHDAAFRRQEKLWRDAGRLRGDPDVARAVVDALNRRPPWRRRRALAATFASVLAVCLLSGAAAWISLTRGTLYATAVGEQSTLKLEDGSALRLDADTRLRVRLDAHARRFWLDRGQALFDVAHEPSRPFTVFSGRATISALGTQFDVRRLPGGGAKVVLLRGRVLVADVTPLQTRSWGLNPGQQLSDTRKLQPPQPADVEAATGWTAGRLVFRDTPLADVLIEANRYGGRPLRLDSSPALARIRVDGAFQAGDTVSLGQALATLYGLDLDAPTSGPLILRPKAASPTSGG